MLIVDRFHIATGLVYNEIGRRADDRRPILNGLMAAARSKNRRSRALVRSHMTGSDDCGVGTFAEQVMNVGFAVSPKGYFTSRDRRGRGAQGGPVCATAETHNRLPRAKPENLWPPLDVCWRMEASIDRYREWRG